MPQPTAYSYIRFSSEKQSQGDSLNRQEKLAQDYAKKHNLNLDTKSYRDLGVSAYKGKNLIEGKLGTFLLAVDEGKIAPGSFLLVESLDRLSRADVDEALELFLSIIRRDITIVTLSDGQSYSRESIKKDKGISLIISITVMIRANEESQIKSDRVKAVWDKKAANGQRLTSVCPSWMSWESKKLHGQELKPGQFNDGEFVLDPDKVDVVRKMFTWFINGHGAPTIARMLNAEVLAGNEKSKSFGFSKFGWTNGTVSNVINNTATYGTLTRKKAEAEPIPNYYPAAINYDTFRRAQAIAKSRQWKGGRKGDGISNLFSGMTYCEKCGAKVRSVSTTSAGVYLRCVSAYSNSGCDAPRIPLKPVEHRILHFLMVEQDRPSFLASDKYAPDRTTPIKAELEAMKQGMRNLVQMAELGGDFVELATRMRELKQKIAATEETLLRMHGEQPIKAEEVIEAQELYRRIVENHIPDGLKRELRLKLQVSIRRIVSRVDLFPDVKSLRLTTAARGMQRVFTYELPEWGINGTRRKGPKDYQIEVE